MGENQQDKQIAVLETNYKNMGEKIDKLEKAVVNGFNELKEEFKCFKQEADDKYASKLTEKIVYAMAGLILVSFFGVIIRLTLN